MSGEMIQGKFKKYTCDFCTLTDERPLSMDGGLPSGWKEYESYHVQNERVRNDS